MNAQQRMLALTAIATAAAFSLGGCDRREEAPPVVPSEPAPAVPTPPVDGAPAPDAPADSGAPAGTTMPGNTPGDDPSGNTSATGSGVPGSTGTTGTPMTEEERRRLQEQGASPAPGQ
ncbi:hypothetical protein IS481_06400 [Caldimonas thermodepolymerans]|jgi:hypothetical protein|nr:hypothetical protein [Caldimonas thermodepolymerans]QPC32779.1 hypothetical protein IS481_06400 [Caldimonas thermodepolymerans]RDI03545.1 hypothetical protein DES46_101227 [Caldimonas thermodepolymerans]UZG45644.1 hypothetical protein ONZ46_06755 [Caldimonas thermodepolymerans]